MSKAEKIRVVRQTLLNWFEKNQRDFPWRNEKTPAYEIILSEILLQRTKAETVNKVYDSFFSKYPDWDSLKDISIENLEEALKPLGLFKQRSRRILKTATEVNRNKGLLPKNKYELKKSTLSSNYLSNSYELLILNKKSALLDVNMARFIGRVFSVKPAKDLRNDQNLQQLAKEITNTNNCKQLNWAILDFASMVCKNTKPICIECPLLNFCSFPLQSKSEINLIEEPQLSMKFKQNQSMNVDKPLNVVSLFSGCGGMDLGFEGGFITHKDSVNRKTNPDFINDLVDDNFVKLTSTKFQTVFSNDILKEARNAWVSYFQKKGYAPEIFHTESIVDLVKMHKKGIKVFPDKVDVVTGGFPCQDFSLSGKRNGFNSHKDHNGALIKTEIPTIETRGQLYIWLKEVIEITSPNIFIAENVKGLVNFDNVKEVIQQDFSSANGNGYIVLDPHVLHAANYGVPQSRERVIFIGIKKSALTKEALAELMKPKVSDKYNPYPAPSHSFTAKGAKLKPPVKLSSIFNDLPEPEFSSDLSQQSYSKAKYMGKHCQGQTEVNINGIGPTIRAEHHGNIEFRRLDLQNGGKITEEIKKKGLKQRRLSVRECALIQTFPSDYEFVIPSTTRGYFLSPSAAYKIIGNAVPPLLAYHIAKRIEKLWNLYFNNNISNGSINKSGTEHSNVSRVAKQYS
jgi:DNA (cytosine-5)-methyltransferase 1